MDFDRERIDRAHRGAQGVDRPFGGLARDQAAIEDQPGPVRYGEDRLRPGLEVDRGQRGAAEVRVGVEPDLAEALEDRGQAVDGVPPLARVAAVTGEAADLDLDVDPAEVTQADGVVAAGHDDDRVDIEVAAGRHRIDDLMAAGSRRT